MDIYHCGLFGFKMDFVCSSLFSFILQIICFQVRKYAYSPKKMSYWVVNTLSIHSIVDPCFLSSLSVICFIYKQRERSEFGMPILHVIFQLLYAHIIILKIMRNIPEGDRRKSSTHFQSAQIIHLLRFHTNELRYTTVLAASLDGLSSKQTIPCLYVYAHIIALLSKLPQNYYWQVSMKVN